MGTVLSKLGLGGVGGPLVWMESLNEDLWHAIMETVSVKTGGLRHALISRACRRISHLALTHVALRPGAALADRALLRQLSQGPVPQSLVSVRVREGSVVRVTDAILLSIAQALPRLQRLRVDNHASQKESFWDVREMPEWDAAKDVGPVTFPGLLRFLATTPALRSLQLGIALLSGCDGPSAAVAAATERRAPAELWDDSRLAVESAAATAVAAALPALRHLHLRLVLVGPQDPLDALLLGLSGLQTLSLDDAGRAPSEDPWRPVRLPRGLASRLPHLRRISLHSPELEHWRGGFEEEASFPGLRVLSLACDSLLTLPRARTLRTLHLKLRNNEALPSGLATLRSLRRLHLDAVGVECLPPSIASLELLEELRIACPRLKCLPPPGEGSSCRALKVLEIQCRAMTGLAGAFCWSPSLQRVDVRVELAKDWPDATFAGFSSLSSLRIYGDWILSLPPSVGYAGRLRTLDLDAVSLATLPHALRDVPLEVLKLRCCKVESLDHVLGAECSSTPCAIPGGSVSGSGHSGEECSSLTELHLSLMRHMTSLARSFRRLRGLQQLTLERCPLLRRLPEDMSFLTALRSVRLASCGLDSLPRALGQLAVDELDIDRCCG